MRVISGRAKGIALKGFTLPGTRPTMDRVKESCFAMIQDKIEGAFVLDLFAGSGNLGIEALSNGAKEAVFVDINATAIETIKSNLKKCHMLEQSTLLRMDYQKALQYLMQKGQTFSIVFLDPPYKMNVIPSILKQLVDFHLLEKDAYIVCETAHPFSVDTILELYKTRKYGDKQIVIYHMI